MLPPVVDRFIAGTTIDSTVLYISELYRETNIHPIANTLGEHYTQEENVTKDLETYIELSNELTDTNIPEPTISIKPSQFGLDISPELFEKTLETLLEETSVFIWVDMEAYHTFSDTVSVVTGLTESYPNRLGLCLQANIKDTPQTIEQIAGKPMKIRLVKGAYSEDKNVSYKHKEKVDMQFKKCIDLAFEKFSGTQTNLAIGSHDDTYVEYAIEKQDEIKLDSFEVQMLMGVRDSYQEELSKSGVTVYRYIPFGSAWMSYFYRRVRERKENAFFAIRAILGN